MAESVDWSRTAEYWTVLSGVVAVASFVGGAVVQTAYRLWRARRFRDIATQLARFIEEGEA